MPDDKPAAAAPPSVVGVVTASFIGTTIEWYDFFLYGTAAALVFNQVFFPTLDPLVGTMASFGTYAVGFFARPVGGIVFGHFGDRMGRKSMLVTTLMLMGLGTFLIGVLPTYDQIGVARAGALGHSARDPGFGVGGEWGGAVLMVVEHGHRGRRGLYASWVQAGVPAGSLLANAVFNLFSMLPNDAFLRWGWRIPFLLGDRACLAWACLSACRFTKARCSPNFGIESSKPRCRSSRSSGDIRETFCWRSVREWPRTADFTFSPCSC